MFLGDWIISVNVLKLDSNEGIGIGKVLGALDGLLPSNTYGIKIESSECSADGNTHGKFEGLLLGAWLVSVVGLDLGINKGTELGL